MGTSYDGIYMDVRKLLVVSLRMVFSSDYRMIRQLRLFDSGYYLHISGDSQAAVKDPFWDYLQKSGDSYFKGGQLDKGWVQLGDPHPLFDTAYYLLRYFPTGLSENPLVHYLTKGWKKGFQPGPFFQPDVYKSRSDWHKGDPLTHYTHTGAPAGISPGLAFDIDWYLDKNPILTKVKAEIIKHYKLHGAKIGKSPLPGFDPDYYLSELGEKEMRENGARDPASHYLTGIVFSESAGESKPNSWFDPEVYVAESGESLQSIPALLDYTSSGVFRGIVTDARVKKLERTPRISVIVPVYNPEPSFLNNCIRSVVFQSYPYWELCLADDCSDREGVRQLLESWAQKDSRIKVTYLTENGGISAATNSAATLATGEYLGFLDNDDEIAPTCLYKVAAAICATGAELLYSDEDLIGDDGTQLSTFRKPDFNPELLLSHNYITHFVVTKRDLFQAVRGFDSHTDGGQDFDLMLKLTEKTDKIHHIPELLYHWRASETSTSINHGQKNYAHEAGRRALENALSRRGLEADVVDSELNFYYLIQSRTRETESVSVLLWAADTSEVYVQSVVDLIKATKHENVRFVLVYPEKTSGEDVLLPFGRADWKLEELPLKLMSVSPGTSKAAALNRAIENEKSTYLAFIDSSLVRVEGDWLEQLSGCFVYKNCSLAVGRRSYEGVDGPSYSMPLLDDHSVHTYYNFLISHTAHANGLHCTQEIPCCSWEITMLKKTTYDALGGFNTKSYPGYFTMVDMALRIRKSGGRVIYTPEAKVDLGNYEKRDQGESVSNQQEKRVLQKDWAKELAQFTSFYNNFRLEDTGIGQEKFKDWFLGEG